MDELTKRYLRDKFQSYYKNAQLFIPPLFNLREWGFIQFDPMPEIIMKRHKSFGSVGELHDYFVGMAPAHSYYSVARYDTPAAPKMYEKGWRGADLIFDLDADHLPGAKQTYSDMLKHVKSEAQKLVDFLTKDFGFSENEIELTFSGGRGYHFHVYNPRVLDLGSSERREIVNYICGRGLNIDSFLDKTGMSGDVGPGTRSYKGKRNVPIKYFIHNSGWGKRIKDCIYRYLKTESEKDEKDMFADIQADPQERKELIKIANDPTALEDIKKDGRLEFFKLTPINFFNYIAKRATDEFGVNFGTNVDEPVTGDIKRLIRVPGSLHGGTGFIVKKLKIDELEAFNPLCDALAFGETQVPVRIMKPFSFELKNKEFNLDSESCMLPEYAAIYLMCRGVANYGS